MHREVRCAGAPRAAGEQRYIIYYLARGDHNRQGTGFLKSKRSASPQGRRGLTGWPLYFGKGKVESRQGRVPLMTQSGHSHHIIRVRMLFFTFGYALNLGYLETDSMSRIYGISCLSLFILWSSASASLGTVATCPVSVSSTPSIDGPFDPPANFAWFGSNALSALIPSSGTWTGMGTDHNYRDKLWWWSEDYDGRSDQNLGLIVTGRRWDDDSVVADVSQATAGSRTDWRGPVMLVGVEFPTTGCWEVRGEYRGQIVTFVVDVKDAPSD